MLQEKLEEKDRELQKLKDQLQEKEDNQEYRNDLMRIKNESEDVMITDDDRT